MKPFLYLIPEAETYKIKRFFSFHHLILCMWMLIGFAILTYSDYTKTGIAIIIITIISLVFLLLKPSKNRVYPYDNILQVDVPRRGLYQETFDFSQILGFELETISFAHITLGAYLYVKTINNNGKEGKHLLGSSLGKKKMQTLSNELDQISKQ
ncbi:hypothetical protein LZQ00_02480 [Sphingobacterium sp. SRCM116780]|uniref:hypothetical protein n=1 Tax=Sphingobacterium sp. SRCM116780 TaxID=2907623 RepID=UPI001F39709F|nr:hypothetical protein [Sphingobacterium sp. SRCM116780]UIR56691.1 hypothetical protein LZQ00_02480 [Sphingobacterium sp. SRCM116780]